MLIGSIITILLLLFIVASYYFFHKAVVRSRKDIFKKSPDMDPDEYKIMGSPDNWMQKHGFDDIVIDSDDGLKLHGYFIKAGGGSGRTVILAHGYSSKAFHMHSFARFYHDDLGFNVLVPDARAHGRSEGKYIGFGWLDRKDYLKWIDKAIELTGEKSSIVLHGISMGGATVLMTVGEDLPAQVKAVVSDCAYTSAYDELSWQLKRLYHLPAFPFLYTTSFLSKLIAGYFFKEASALEQVKKTGLPILFIHGGSDSFVPHEMVNQLYDAAVGEKELLIIPDAGHGLASEVDYKTYVTRVAEFLGKYIVL
jgi:fermentation-respiration switch protein FrsA (DUF1100 family)